MTDRIRHLTVTLCDDIRDDDVEPIVQAILQMRAVASVKPHVVSMTDHLARETVRSELRLELHRAVDVVLDRDKARSRG